MKKIITLGACLCMVTAAMAQNKANNINFELGNGLTVDMNNGQHQLKLGGYIQTEAAYNWISDDNSEKRMGVRRAYFNLGGKFMNDKLSFLLQMNFADSYPLLDAWIAYKPWKQFSVTVGQKQSFSGTRSMMFYDYALAMGERSLSDRTFFGSGREFGLFLESQFLMWEKVGIEVDAALTSGDGRNSFGSSTDYDHGGLKYSGRISVYPLGFFAPGNDLTDTDFAREQTPKLVVGGAYSYNDGTSNPIGEGHGDFEMYNAEGKARYPDYQKMSLDMMMKYRGMTLLAEYTNAIGAGLKGLYTAPNPNAPLEPRQIANYLALGNGYNFQAGYLFPKNWAVDVRYSFVRPEWSDNQTQIKKSNSIGAGVAKYFIDNRLKVQLLGFYKDYPDLTTKNKEVSIQLLAHIIF